MRRACSSSLRRSARSRPTWSTPSDCRQMPAMPPGDAARAQHHRQVERLGIGLEFGGCRRRRDAACRARRSIRRARARRRASATSCRSPSRVEPKRSMMRSASSARPQPRSSTRDDRVERQEVEQPLDLGRRDRVAVVVVAMRDRAEFLTVHARSAARGSFTGSIDAGSSPHGATRSSSSMPGNASTVHNKIEVEPAGPLDDPAGRRVDHRARHRGKAREQRELRRRVARIGRRARCRR